MKRTPLHYAALSNDVQMATFLIKNGANVNAMTRGGETPLMKAAEKGHVEMVRQLLSQNPDVFLCNKV